MSDTKPSERHISPAHKKILMDIATRTFASRAATQDGPDAVYVCLLAKELLREFVRLGWLEAD
jgi:hypothetical protein